MRLLRSCVYEYMRPLSRCCHGVEDNRSLDSRQTLRSGHRKNKLYMNHRRQLKNYDASSESQSSLDLQSALYVCIIKIFFIVSFNSNMTKISVFFLFTHIYKGNSRDERFRKSFFNSFGYMLVWSNLKNLYFFKVPFHKSTPYGPLIQTLKQFSNYVSNSTRRSTLKVVPRGLIPRGTEKKIKARWLIMHGSFRPLYYCLFIPKIVSLRIGQAL
jgi:hypothetical protein